MAGRTGRSWIVLYALLLGSAMTLPALDSNRTLTQYVHRIWTVQQGLPAGTIYAIWQTNDGFLWLGTQTGLERFDGVRFTAGENSYPGMPSGLWIRTAYVDAQGALWVGTNEKGVYRFLNGKSTHYSTENGLSSDLIYCLVPGTQGDMWICTGNGLAHVSNGKLDLIHIPHGRASDTIRATCLAPDGTLWVGGEAPVLYEMKGGRFDGRPLRSIPSDSGVRAIACGSSAGPSANTTGDASKDMWVGTTAGLLHMEGSKQRLYTVRDGLADDSVLSLTQSPDGSLWVGTRSGFSRVRGGEIESFRPEDGLSQSSVFSVYEDREGSLWVGTKHGLNQFVDGRAIPYTVNEGLPSNAAGPLLQDSRGGIWVGTLDAGLAKFSGRRFTAMTTGNGLSSNMILSLAQDSDGGVWVGTSHGLNRLMDGRVVRTFNRAAGLPSDEIRCLYEDPGKTLWVGTAAGLAMYRDGRFKMVPGAPRESIVVLAGDAKGRLLFSTDRGVFHIERQGGESVAREITPHGASLRGVDAIHLDPEGQVWLATSGGGLLLLQGGLNRPQVTVFWMHDGLFDSEIYGIASDDHGRLWMACSKGIFSVARSDLLAFAAGRIKKVASTPYSPTDALRVIECKPGVQPGLWKMRDGTLWFSTIRGLIVIDPDRVQRHIPPPPVVIENPIVNGQSEPASKIGRLAPGQKNLEFNYTGLSFLAPTRITFRYMLEGYDKDWVNAGTRRDAFYTNLPPGNFRFRVTACTVDGTCNDQGSSVAFSLAPHYYQQVWFLPLLAGLAGLAVFAVYRLRIRTLRERYDLILAERSRIARELHDTLIQGFSGVTMAMQALAGRLRAPEERETLDDIIRDAASCLRETRRSVAGLRGARAAPQAGSGLASALAEAARQITETKDVRLKLKLDKGPANLPAEFEYNLLRIATEAISNAVKHSGARNIEVTLACSPESLRLSVADDGTGFETAGNGHLRPGHYGLIGMKERAAHIGAEFDFDSALGRGTTVSVQAPLGRAAAVESVK
jgi:ligand-binding sensor domain-containing protein/anti-sigma regulatory factor (Ser/Thr protein kinase)